MQRFPRDVLAEECNVGIIGHGDPLGVELLRLGPLMARDGSIIILVEPRPYEQENFQKEAPDHQAAKLKHDSNYGGAAASAVFARWLG